MFPRSRSGLTLVELLVVVAVLAILMAILVPTISSIGSANKLGDGTAEIAALLESARAHAIAENTYTWVGFHEHAPGAPGPHDTPPPYAGQGAVRIAAVASTDGTGIFDANDPSTDLPPDRIRPLGRVRNLEGIHLADLGAPTGGDPGTLEGRPDAYAGSFSHFARISSESGNTSKFPFAVGDIKFYKTIRFNPLGESHINSTYSLKRVAEIGILPVRGDAPVADGESNGAAVQVSGLTGEVGIYRR